MAPSEIRGPDLAGVVADANAVGLEHVVIGGLAPLDYETVAAGAVDGSLRGSPFRVAGLRSIVGFKRLANRRQDRGRERASRSAKRACP
jgi:hypothetical protein